MSRRKLSTIVAALGLALLGAMAVWLPANAQPDNSAARDGVEITLEQISPLALSVDDELSFTGTLTNTSGEPLSSVTIWWRMKTAVLTAATYEEWFAHDEAIEPLTLARHDLPEPIEPGRAVTYTMSIPAESSPFDYGSPTGVRGMELVVTAKGEDGATHRDAVRSTLVWFGDGEPAHPVTVAVPLTAAATDWDDAYDQRVPVGIHSAARLLDLIDTFTGMPVVWGVDPAVLDSVPIGGLETVFDRVDDAEAPPEHPPFEWPTPAPLGELAAAIRTHHHDVRVDHGSFGAGQVVSLGWASPAYDSLARAGASGADLLAANARYSAEVLHSAGLVMQNQVAWSLSPLSAQAAANLGARTIIAPPVPGGAYLPSPAGDSPGTPAVYAPAQEFLDLLTSKVTAEELAAQSLLLASSSPAHVLTLPVDLDEAAAQRVVDNLRTLTTFPWLTFGTLTRTIDELASANPVPGASLAPTRISAATIDTAAAALHQADALAGVTPEPAKFAALAYSTIFPPLSVSAGDSAASAELAELTEATLLDSPLSIQQPATVNLISQGGTLPIAIENASHITLAPTVVLNPADARLLADDPVSQELQPQQATTVNLPITAVANGNVEATIHLLGPAGEELAEPQSFTVRVRADWETTGTAIIAGLVAGGFVLGLVRNIRKASAPRARE